MTPAQKAAETRRRRAEAKARIEAALAEAQRIVASGKCPNCGSGLRRNLSMAGWWQCEQFGSEWFRKDPSRPSCSFQTFTE